jgi:hypothetical protein
MSDYLRFRRGTLQTPVHHYTHPRTGRRITVIGTMHMGEPDYYTGLRTVISNLEARGALVQCEASALLPHDQHGLTDDERTVLTTRELRQELELRRITELGWVRQLDALDYPERWQLVDLDMLEIIRRVGPAVMLRGEQRGIKMFDRPDNDPRSIERFRLTLHLMFTMFQLTVLISAQRASRKKPSTGIDAVLIDQRDAVALAGVASTEQDVVLVWGCAHLPGLEAGITEQGFARTGDTEWHTAATLPSIRSILSRLLAPPHTTSTTTPDTTAAVEAVPAATRAESTTNP